METLHTVSLLWPHVSQNMSVLDIGCGEGWVADELVTRGLREVATVDVVDVRRARRHSFALYDGVHLPFPDGRFDVAMLNFVLHHVPDERKVALLGEALRVARDTVFILRTRRRPPSIASSAGVTARPTAARSPAPPLSAS
jgi:ubiquinone/menaquinone biosynthesis C-methylase UbiE